MNESENSLVTELGIHFIWDIKEREASLFAWATVCRMTPFNERVNTR